jgi:hypothetical protein
MKNIKQKSYLLILSANSSQVRTFNEDQRSSSPIKYELRRLEFLAGRPSRSSPFGLYPQTRTSLRSSNPAAGQAAALLRQSNKKPANNSKEMTAGFYKRHSPGWTTFEPGLGRSQIKNALILQGIGNFVDYSLPYR